MLAVSTNNYHRPARIESLDGDRYGLTVIPDQDGPIFAAHHEYGIAGTFPRGCTIPDLDDPATLGCLLHLVREAWVQPTAYVEIREGRSRVCATYGTEATIALGPRWTIGGEAHALVAALEAAP